MIFYIGYHNGSKSPEDRKPTLKDEYVFEVDNTLIDKYKSAKLFRAIKEVIKYLICGIEKIETKENNRENGQNEKKS